MRKAQAQSKEYTTFIQHSRRPDLPFHPFPLYSFSGDDHLRIYPFIPIFFWSGFCFFLVFFLDLLGLSGFRLGLGYFAAVVYEAELGEC
jgi:hypothetical protein